jgi:hypothetical protein
MQEWAKIINSLCWFPNTLTYPHGCYYTRNPKHTWSSMRTEKGAKPPVPSSLCGMSASIRVNISSLYTAQFAEHCLTAVLPSICQSTYKVAQEAVCTVEPIAATATELMEQHSRKC